MNRRIVVNLGVFLVLGIVMCVWALQNVLSFDVLTRPYPVYADFTSSPGLSNGSEVAYLGVQVGRVGQVRLVGNHVRVRLDIDRGQRLPAGLNAAAARMSAVGEPYVALTPTSAASAAGPTLRPHATIPVSDTSVPPTYGTLFAAVNKALGAVNPQDVGTIAHELYLGWNGRADSLREIINGGDQITTAYARNSRLIDGLTDSLTRITHVLAQNSGALGEGIDNLATVSDALAGVRNELTLLRDRGPGLLSQVNSLLVTSRPDLECTLESLGTTIPQFATPSNLRDLSSILAQAPGLVSTLKKVFRVVDGDYVANVVFVITLRTEATEEFRYPLPQPTAKAIPSCPDGRTPGTAKQAPYLGGNPQSVVPPQYRNPSDPSRTGTVNGAGASDDTPSGPPGWLLYLPPVIGLLVLLRFAAGAMPVLARNRRRRK